MCHGGESAAHGGVPEVDGRPVSAPGGERGSLAVGLEGGLHRVQVFDAKDRLLANSTAEVGAEEQVRLELRQGRLLELGRGPLPGGCPNLEAAVGRSALNVVVGAQGASGVREEGSVVVVLGAERPAPPAAVPPPSAVAVTATELASIIGAIDAAAFSSDKIGALRGVVGDRWFTIVQVGALLDRFAHSSDKVEAAWLLAPRTVDPLNAYLLEEHLAFSSDKAAVRRLCAR